MPRYLIPVLATYHDYVEVEAGSEEEAIARVKDEDWNPEDYTPGDCASIVLDEEGDIECLQGTQDQDFDYPG